ncbi:hypothetical protein CALVIDRAFT_207357 [Calocera viscosa TUFC12733]|uniref:Uncharacterized protein n=1 Tax=Calocera viscosa (strain TUFC12733) TaxID=1330018 RepID=A0A167R8S6_CALVF|nr:hypothetical protein CALVIDRAFT_207357 [Calocera viscosa TUFC12733]
MVRITHSRGRTCCSRVFHIPATLPSRPCSRTIRLGSTPGGNTPRAAADGALAVSHQQRMWDRQYRNHRVSVGRVGGRANVGPRHFPVGARTGSRPLAPRRCTSSCGSLADMRRANQSLAPQRRAIPRSANTAAAADGMEGGLDPLGRII